MLVSVRESFDVWCSLVFPTALVVWLGVLIAEVVQAGLWFSWRQLGPEWSRLNFFSGFKRMCGIDEGGDSSLPVGLLYELAKCSVYATGFFAILWIVCSELWREVAGAEVVDQFGFADLLVSAALRTLGPAVLVALIFGAGDLLIARRKRTRRLMMDTEELKRELRESEGDPETKNLRKQLHQELLLHGILEGVRRAKVIVVGRTRSDSAENIAPGSLRHGQRR